MKKSDINADSMPFKNIGTFWEPACDQNGFLLQPMFTLLSGRSVPTCELLREQTYVKIELPPSSNGMRRFLHGYLMAGTTDVFLGDCVAMTMKTVVRYLGIVMVPQQYILRIIYPA